MPIPVDIYDADAKKHNSIINNEQQHDVKKHKRRFNGPHAIIITIVNELWHYHTSSSRI
jgi:hypothetical protein